jgi:hypothetical protein
MEAANRVQEVIPMRSKAYGALAVNHISAAKLAEAHAGEAVMVGTDIGKFEVRAICRWAKGEWERPWRVKNPSQLAELVAVLQELRQGRENRFPPCGNRR